MINAVTNNYSKEPEGPDPIQICLQKGADINEVDPVTKDFPVLIIAKKHVEAQQTGQPGLNDVLAKLVQNGGCLYQKNQATGEAPRDVLPGFGVPAQLGHAAPPKE